MSYAANATKASQYFVSERGRRLCMWITGLSTGSIFGGYIYLHTLGLEKWQDTFQLYKHGFKTPLTPNVISQTEEVKNDLVGINDRTKKFLQFFTVYGFDVFHAGSTKLRLGALIGLPRNFSYETKADIERADIIVENNPVEWGSEDGELLQNALVLSKNAQKFAIAREIYMANTHYVHAMGFIHASAIGLYYGLAVYANDRFQGLFKPRSFRICLYSLIGTFMYGVWSVSGDILTKLYESSADKSASSLGKNYAEGGVEFYAKILQRNIALRALMGTSGEKQYTAFGNDVELIRQRHVPYTVRKDNLIKALSKYDSSSENESK